MSGWFVTSWLVLAACASAQPQHERRTFAHVQQLRAELATALVRSEASVREAIVRRLVSDEPGNPLVKLARACAQLRGVAADSAFVLRHGLQCLATPEVVDDATYPVVHLTMHAPYLLPAVSGIEFRLRIADAVGEVRWQGRLVESTAADDLVRYRARLEAPVQELADGTYHVTAETWIDGAGPRDTDPVATATFHVLRGFPERVKAIRARLAALPAGDPAELAFVQGAVAEVERAFVGEPAAGTSNVARDLQQVETMLDNLAAGEPVLSSLTGWVNVAMATGDKEAARLALRLTKPAQSRPLLLFVPGVPAFDHLWARPTSPPSTAPGWTRTALTEADFDAQGAWQLAVMESPGRYASAATAVIRVVEGLRQTLDLQPRVVLVGELEGAAAITSALASGLSGVAGVVLIAGGALDPATAARLQSVPVLVAPALAHPGNINLERAVRLLDREADRQVFVIPAERTPWALGLRLLLPEIESFAALALG